MTDRPFLDSSMLQMFDSFGHHIMSRIISPINTSLRKLFFTSSRYTCPTSDKAGWIMLSKDFKKNGRQVYKDHCEMARSLVPPENLLEYHVQDGWEPLCKFLGQPIPDVPIPNSNEKDVFLGRKHRVPVKDLKECFWEAMQRTAYFPCL